MYVKAANGLTVRIPAENYDGWRAVKDKLKAGEDEPGQKMLEQLRSGKETGAEACGALRGPKKGGGMEADFTLISSAYSRTQNNICNLIRRSEILYLNPNKNRTDTWLIQLGVQFPSRQPVYGSIGGITYNGSDVKIQGVLFSDIGQADGGVNGKFSRDLESIRPGDSSGLHR